MTALQTALDLKIEELSDRLDREYGHFSSVRRMTDNEPFREIIAIGPSALPSILKRLRADRSVHTMMAAVSRISNGGPEIPNAYRGVVRVMVRMYADWLTEHGYGP